MPFTLATYFDTSTQRNGDCAHLTYGASLSTTSRVTDDSCSEASRCLSLPSRTSGGMLNSKLENARPGSDGSALDGQRDDVSVLRCTVGEFQCPPDSVSPREASLASQWPLDSATEQSVTSVVVRVASPTRTHPPLHTLVRSTALPTPTRKSQWQQVESGSKVYSPQDCWRAPNR